MSEDINNAVDALKKIDSLIEEASGLVEQATILADKHGLEFSLNMGGYGMGGWYQGNEEDRGEYCEDGWMASSQSC